MLEALDEVVAAALEGTLTTELESELVVELEFELEFALKELLSEDDTALIEDGTELTVPLSGIELALELLDEGAPVQPPSIPRAAKTARALTFIMVIPPCVAKLGQMNHRAIFRKPRRRL